LVSLEDDLMRLFSNAGIISSLLEKSFKEGEPLEHPLLNRSIGTAQKRVEGQNYSMRKRLLQYDDVLNQQRQIVYGLRNRALQAVDSRQTILNIVEEEIEARLDVVFPDPEGEADRRAAETFVYWYITTFHMRIDLEDILARTKVQLTLLATDRVRSLQLGREEHESPEILQYLERNVLLRAIDRNWQNHLTEMEDLRRGVGLRTYAQKDPLNEYKAEAFKAFERLMQQLRTDTCSGLFRTATSMEALEGLMRRAQGQTKAIGPAEPGAGTTTETSPASVSKPEPFRRLAPKIGRNAVVRIRKGPETQDLKWKKAEALVRDEGWEVIETLSE
jgi:preprotein translocase subunit SecA